MLQAPRGHCYVLGDNSQHSRDSRSFGAIPLDSIVFTVIWRWGPDGFNWIDHTKQPWKKDTAERSPTPVPSESAREPVVLKAPKARIVIGRGMPKNPVIED